MLILWVLLLGGVEIELLIVVSTTYVPHPNAVCHIDGNMSLIRWGFVIHGGIDGYSRMVTYLSCLAERTLCCRNFWKRVTFVAFHPGSDQTMEEKTMMLLNLCFFFVVLEEEVT